MTIKHEIKSQLAKLLATEDLVVEHRKIETAEFNVQTRVLTLPLWDKASENVIDMLVSHEVGHALYTPDEEWWEEYEIHPSFVNIVEDARIEKLMKRRYDGISKTFYKGYTELHNDDFFKVKKKNISEMILADRVNLYYKIGTYYDIPFSTEERFFLHKIDLCETFEDTLKAAKALYDYCLAEQKRKEKEEAEDFSNFDLELDEDGDGERPMTGTRSEAVDTDSEGDSEGDVDDDGEKQEEAEIKVDTHIGGHEGVTEVSAETVESLDDALRNLTNEGARENVYLELPKLDVDKVIIPNEEIHQKCNERLVEAQRKAEEQEKKKLQCDQRHWDYYDQYGMKKYLDETEKDFAKFKKSAQKEVNYLVKEFECKKSASAYARATTSRTGVLDTTKLHTYKYNDDLFKKVSVIPEGKNHGLVFILDWSGSMSHVMMDTIKQLYNLMWFCKKVQIPFDVYAFTTSYPKTDRDERGYAAPLYEAKDNMMVIENQFSLMNLFTSQTRIKELNQQMLNIFRIVGSYRDYTARDLTPFGLELSGTPLNETIVALHDLIPQFQAKTKVEKVNCVILTDGEGYQLSYHRTVNRSLMGESYFGRGNWGDECILRNRKTGKTYNCGYQYHDFTKMLLRNISDELRNVNFVGIRIMDGRDAKHFVQMNSEDFNSPEVEKTMQQWRKTKTLILEDVGYKVYLGLSSSAVGNDAEFEVKEDASKADIKRAFTKSLKNKKMNKKILSKFIEMVA